MDNYTENMQILNEWTEVNAPTQEYSVYSESRDEISAENDKHAVRVKRRISAPVLTFQLILCLTLLVSFFIGKLFLPEIYDNVNRWYTKELTSSLVFSGNFRDFDYTSLFASTEDEI